MFASLKIRNYRLFFFGQLISLTGSWAQIIAQDWLVLELSNNSATALALVTALQFIPALLFTLYAGLLADRLDKRILLIVVLSGLMVATALMGVLVSVDLAALWHVYVFAFVTGVGGAFEKTIRTAFVPEMVGSELLRNAVGMGSATFNAARLIGPALGGFAIAGIGIGPTFLVNAATYLAVLSGLFAMRSNEMTRTPPAPREPGQLAEGVRYVWGRKDLLLAMAMGMVIGAFAMSVNLLLALRARVDLQVSAAALGTLSSALAVGALIGAIVASRAKGRAGAGAQLAYAASLGISLVVLAFAQSFWASALALVPVGALLISHNAVAQARIQLNTPARLRGRVVSLYMLVFFGAAPLGAASVGPIADAFGPSVGFAVIGGVVLMTASTLWIARSYRHGARVRVRIEPHPHLRIVRTDTSIIRIPDALPRIAR